MKGNTYAPKETIVGPSKLKPWIENFIWMGLMIFFIFKLFTVQSEIRYLSVILIFVMIYGIYSNIKKTNKSPKILLKLSEKGITPQNSRLIKWSNIEKAEIIVKPNYSNSVIQKEYLIISSKQGKREVFINDLDITALRLEYLIKIYRNRFNKKSEKQ